MMPILRLIRLPNLLLIVLVQLLVRHCLVLPAFTAEYFITGEFPQGMSEFLFACLVLSTVLLAAGGYIINDCYDTVIDEINKPGRVIIGHAISRSSAQFAYGTLTVLGCLLGLGVAFAVGKLSLVFIHLFVAASLWMYASQLKKRLLVGNILIAVLSALSVMVVGLFEPEFYRNIVFLAVYGGFAFALSLIREIIKDMEDLAGDERGQVKSLPVRFGIKRTKLVVLILLLLTAWGLAEILEIAFSNVSIIKFRNLLIGCEFPFVILLYLVATATEKKDFHLASSITKLVMLLGILTMVPLYYYFIR